MFKIFQSDTFFPLGAFLLLGCQDSNLGMTAPKAVALPLGYTPISDFNRFIRCLVSFSGHPINEKAQFMKNWAKNIPKKGFGVNLILKCFRFREQAMRLDENVWIRPA
jgi:hypothetical protein